MKFDPKLKDCMSEMMEIAKKYDVAAFVNLGSKTHGEFDFQFPSWSLARFESQENGEIAIRIKAKQGEVNHDDLEATVAFIMGMRDTCSMHITNMEKIIGLLHKVLEIDHDPEWHLGNQGH